MLSGRACGRDQTHHKMYHLQTNTKFNQVASAYLQQFGHIGGTRFIFDGQSVKASSDRTLAELGIGDGDYVDICLRLGGPTSDECAKELATTNLTLKVEAHALGTKDPTGIHLHAAHLSNKHSRPLNTLVYCCTFFCPIKSIDRQEMDDKSTSKPAVSKFSITIQGPRCEIGTTITRLRAYAQECPQLGIASFDYGYTRIGYRYTSRWSPTDRTVGDLGM